VNADTDVDLDELDRRCQTLTNRLEQANSLLAKIDEQSCVSPPVGTLTEGLALMTAFYEARSTLRRHVSTLNVAITAAHDNLVAIAENYRAMEQLNARQFSQLPGIETTVQ